MPKKNNTKSKRTQQVGAKLIKESQRQAKRDLTEKWRFLRKVGAYQTKVSAAQSRLTESRIREINKRFKEIQAMKKYVAGNVVRPVQQIVKRDKIGRQKLVYDFTQHFTFVPTKNKTSLKQNVKKTRKGYILEKTAATTKVRINRKGEIIESKGGFTRRRRKYNGLDLIKFIDDIEKGKIKMRPDEMIVFHRWGSANSVIGTESDALDLFAGYMRGVERTMSAKQYEMFLELSYVEFIKNG